MSSWFLLFTTSRYDDWYDAIVFNTTSLYNTKAPDPWIAWSMGLTLSACTLSYWYLLRWRPLRHVQTESLQLRPHHMAVRTLIATLSDNHDTCFTLLRLSSQAFLFLGGFQMNYEMTLVVMMVYYLIVSCGDSIRVLITRHECPTLNDLDVVAHIDRALLVDVQHHKDGTTSIDLASTNVYEDLSRDFFMVTMVFVTQCILIAFIIVDLYKNETMATFDGTLHVPVVGTLGSWTMYVLGILMKSVYIVGPRSSFGTSKQHPHYWMQALICAKQPGAHVTWFDAYYKLTRQASLQSPGHSKLWIRFLMSYLINGFGFHVLVHALPIQVAGQSSLTAIVLRAVGMLYLVDLDDSSETVLTLREGSGNAVENTAMATRGSGGSHGYYEEMDQLKPNTVNTTAIGENVQQGIAETRLEMNNLQRKLELLEQRFATSVPVVSEAPISYETSMIREGSSVGSVELVQSRAQSLNWNSHPVRRAATDPPSAASVYALDERARTTTGTGSRLV
jgi:hypothetical protein